MHALTLLVPAEAVDPVSDRLADEWNALSVSVEDAEAGSAAEQPVFDEPGLAAAKWRRARVTALFVDEPSATAAAAGLRSNETLPDELLIETIGRVDEQDWVRVTQSQFGPIEIEPGFWIVPSWDAPPPAAHRLIRLDPGMAFGTGTHPTTRMCLRWVARAAARRDAPWARVLDYGCGSGVLAIAASLFGAQAVDAVDIDPVAVTTTRSNAAANDARIVAGDAAAVAGPYALILANILSAPLKLLAPLLAAQLEVGGKLVLSGILERQADELRQAYAPWLALAVTDHDDGWILMTGTRSA